MENKLKQIWFLSRYMPKYLQKKMSSKSENFNFFEVFANFEPFWVIVGRLVSQPVGWWVNRSMHWLGEIVEIFQKGYVTLDHGSSKACFSRHRYGFIGNQTENYISVLYNLFIMKDVLLHERIFRIVKELAFIQWKTKVLSPRNQVYQVPQKCAVPPFLLRLDQVSSNNLFSK